MKKINLPKILFILFILFLFALIIAVYFTRNEHLLDVLSKIAIWFLPSGTILLIVYRIFNWKRKNRYFYLALTLYILSIVIWYIGAHAFDNFMTIG